MENRKHPDNSFLTGLVLGGVIGAALAFIFSKEEGEEARKTLAKKGKVLLKNLGEILEENTSDDLKKHWGEEDEEKEEKKEKQEEKPEKKKELTPTSKKVARKFFHRNGKRLG